MFSTFSCNIPGLLYQGYYTSAKYQGHQVLPHQAYCTNLVQQAIPSQSLFHTEDLSSHKHCLLNSQYIHQHWEAVTTYCLQLLPIIAISTKPLYISRLPHYDHFHYHFYEPLSQYHYTSLHCTGEQYQYTRPGRCHQWLSPGIAMGPHLEVGEVGQQSHEVFFLLLETLRINRPCFR